MVDEVTAARGYEKPFATNLLSYDVGRLRAALDGLDTDMAATIAALAGKAAISHAHAIDDVSGLTAALAGKAATAHTHTLGSLTDVSLTGASSGSLLRLSGGVWGPAALGIGDVTGLSSALSSLSASIPAVDDGTY